MYITRERVTVTTNGSGDGTGYTKPVNGAISHIVYTLVDFAAGVDFTITVEDTGENVWTEANVNASKTVAPRQPTHDMAGVGSVYASLGEPVEDYIVVANSRIKIVVAQGGATKTGTFDVIVIGTIVDA
jgi:hypothetical protein